MNIKPVAYYWVDKDAVDNILKEGISVSGGLHATAVYMSSNSKEFYNRGRRDSLFLVDLRGIESQSKLFPEKRWILSMENVPPQNVHYVGSDFQTEQDLENKLLEEKNNFSKSFYKSNYKMKNLESFTPQEQKNSYQDIVSKHF